MTEEIIIVPVKILLRYTDDVARKQALHFLRKDGIARVRNGGNGTWEWQTYGADGKDLGCAGEPLERAQ